MKSKFFCQKQRYSFKLCQGEPNNWGDDEDKVEIQWYNDAQFGTKGPGQWNDIEPSATRSYMCYHQLDRSETQTGSLNCPEGWQQQASVNSFCYKLVTGQDTDFNGAQEQRFESKAFCVA